VVVVKLPVIPIGRNRPGANEIAIAALFLASDDSSFRHCDSVCRWWQTPKSKIRRPTSKAERSREAWQRPRPINVPYPPKGPATGNRWSLKSVARATAWAATRP